MKNLRRALAAVMCIAVILVMGTGCGKSAPYADSPYLGTWLATTCSYGGYDFSVADIIGGDFVVTLDEEGNVKAEIADEEETGTWETTETGIKIMDSQSEMEFTDKDGKLILENEGVEIVFEKKSE